MKKMAIVRLIVLLFVLVNQGLVLSGKSPLPFNDEDVENGVTALLTFAVSVWTWYQDSGFVKKEK